MRHIRSLALIIALSLVPAAATSSLAQVGQPEVQQAESAMTFAASRASAVSRLKRVPSVGVIRLESLRYCNDGFDVAQLHIYAEKHTGGIDRLRAALKANPVTRRALAARSIPLHRVVGVQVGTSGALRVYIL